MVSDEPSPDELSDEGTPSIFLEFLLADRRYLAAVDQISTTLYTPTPTPLPRTPPAIKGVVDVNGEITTLIDPSPEMDGIPTQSELGKVLLQLGPEIDNQRIGLIVDDILGVQTIYSDDIVPLSETPELQTDNVSVEVLSGVVPPNQSSDKDESAHEDEFLTDRRYWEEEQETLTHRSQQRQDDTDVDEIRVVIDLSELLTQIRSEI